MSTYVRYPASQGLVSAVTNPLVLTSGTLSILDAGAAQAGIVSTGAQTFGGAKTFAGDIFLGANFTHSQANDAVTTGANANIASHTTTNIRLTNASLTSLASIGTTGVLPGHIVIITNVTGNAITIVNNYGSAPAGTALRTGNQQDMSLASSGSCYFVYDGTGLNWKMIATPPFRLDGLDGTTKTSSGAAISGNTLYMQTADGTYPGLVSTAAQTFAGAKTFSSPVKAPGGSVSAPGLTFSTETNTGIYLDGALDMALAVNGQQALNLMYNGASQVNWGIGTAAVSGAGNYFVADRVYNGDVYYQWANTSSGGSSCTIFDILNGPASNHMSLENRAYTVSGYLAGGCALAANSNMTQLNIMAEYASAYIAFNVGGRTLATERARLTATELSLVKIPLAIGGSTSGYITHAASATTTSHTLTWPATQGGASTVLTNDGAGNLSWGAAGGSGTVTSVAMSVPAFLSVSGSPITSSGTLAVSLSGTALPIANGGTGATTATAAFDALSPMTTLGDTIYGGASGTRTRLAGNTTTTKKYLAQTGDGANSAAPAWSQPAFSELSGSVAASQMPALTGDVTTSAGAVATTIANSAVTNAKMANMNNNTIKGNVSGSAAAPSDLTAANVASIFTVPTIQKFTSGSGTYTTPSNCRWIRVRLVGGGGGGSGGGTSAGVGSNGGDTTFGSSLLSGSAGAGAGVGSGSGGAGGSASLGSGPIGVAIAGEYGSGGIYDAPAPAQNNGGVGGGSALFGGRGWSSNNGTAGSGIANTGGGGGGGCAQSVTAYSGCGGGAGGSVDAIITSPSATYSYSVGSGGGGGTAGTNGAAGGAGAAGIIIVEEHYI